MIKGIIFFEDGTLQLIGELNTLSGIIKTMKEAIPSFEKQESQRIFNSLSDEQIAALIKAREAEGISNTE